MTATTPRKGPRKQRGVHPLVIAVLTILGTVFVTYYAFSQQLPFSHSYTLYALVNNSVNVRTDSPVRIAGIDVGSVQSTSPAGQATRVDFTLDDTALPIHRDATIRIRSRLFLEGGYYLELDPGSPSAPALHDGDTIPLSQTTSPVQFYNVLSTFDVAARTSLRQLLGTIDQGFGPAPGHAQSDSGAGGLKRAIPAFTPVLKDTALISRSLRGTQAGDMERLLASGSQVTGALAGSSAQLVDLIASLNRTSSALAAADGALGQSLVGLDQTLQVTPGALTVIDRALPPVANLAIALQPSLKAAPPLVDSVISSVRELSAVVAPSVRGPLLAALLATFQEFPTVVSELAGAFPVSEAITRCLSSRVTPDLTRIVPDGILTSNRPVWQDFVHFLPSVGGATGSFDANGHYTRTLAGAGSNTLTGGTLGTLPGVGPLVGSAPPGNGSLLGARPAWVGDLQPADFRPDVPCGSQPLPSLASPTAAADLHSADRSGR